MRAAGATYYVGLRHFRRRGLDISYSHRPNRRSDSLQTMSARSPLICAMRHPQKLVPSDSCGMIGSRLFMSFVSRSSQIMINVLAQRD